MNSTVGDVRMIPMDAVVPEDIDLVLRSRGLSRQLLALEAQRLLALSFFQSKVLSMGQAARLAGLSKWDFIDLLGARNVPVIDYPEDELNAELENVDLLEGILET